MTDRLFAGKRMVLPVRRELSVPFFPQQKYQCGPAALAAVLNDAGVVVTPQALVSEVYLPARKGSLQPEMLAASRRYDRIPYLIAPDLEVLLREIDEGRPVLVLQNLGVKWYPRWHYAVATGYDLTQQQLVLNSGNIENYHVALKVFERTWQRGGHWAFVVLQPGQIPATATANEYFFSLAAFEKVGSDEAVKRAYLGGLDKWPYDRNLLMGLANHLYAIHELQGAKDYYARVIEHHPEYGPAHNNLAQVYLELGKYERALMHARRAILSGDAHLDEYRQTLSAIEERMHQKHLETIE